VKEIDSFNIFLVHRLRYVVLWDCLA